MSSEFISKLNNKPKSKPEDKLKTWLNKKMDEYTATIYYPPVSEFKTSGKYEEDHYDLYYNKDDIDMKMNDNTVCEFAEAETDQDEKNINNSVEDYGKEKVFIPQNTNRSHCSYLLKLLIHETEKSNLYINVPTIKGEMIEYHEMAIFDKNMKENFYKFCMENSIK